MAGAALGEGFATRLGVGAGVAVGEGEGEGEGGGVVLAATGEGVTVGVAAALGGAVRPRAAVGVSDAVGAGWTVATGVARTAGVGVLVVVRVGTEGVRVAAAGEAVAKSTGTAVAAFGPVAGARVEAGDSIANLDGVGAGVPGNGSAGVIWAVPGVGDRIVSSSFLNDFAKSAWASSSVKEPLDGVDVGRA